MPHRRILLLLPLAAALLLAGDLLQLAGSTFAWTVVLAIAFAGAIPGASMQVLFRAWSVLEEAGHEEARRSAPSLSICAWM